MLISFAIYNINEHRMLLLLCVLIYIIVFYVAGHLVPLKSFKKLKICT